MFTCLASVSFPVGFEYLILQSVVRLAEVRVGGGGGIATSATVKPQSKVMLHWCTIVLELHTFFVCLFVSYFLPPSLSSASVTQTAQLVIFPQVSQRYKVCSLYLTEYVIKYMTLKVLLNIENVLPPYTCTSWNNQ